MRWSVIASFVGLCACSATGTPAGSGFGGAATAGQSALDSGTSSSSGGGSSGSHGSGGSPSTGGKPSTGGSNASGGNPSSGGQAGRAGTGGGPVGPNCTGTPTPTGTPPALTAGTWANLTPAGLPFGTSIVVFMQGMAIDPCNPFTLYLAVEGYDATASKSGLYKSGDAGASWRKVGNLDMPIRIRVDPTDTRHLYACDGVRGGTMGFWVSHDAGESWVLPAGFKSWADSEGSYDVYDVAVDPNDVKHVLISFHSGWRSSNAGVAESKDGGETWSGHQVPGAGYAGMSITFLRSSSIWLLGTQSSGFWRTTDSGATWTQVTTECIEHGGGNVYYAKSGLYASAFDRNLRSTDDGVSWTKVGPNGGYNAIIGDGSRLYALKRFGPIPFTTSSEDDGLTWTNLDSQNFDQGAFEMAVDPVNGILYAANWGAGFWALKLKH